MRARPGKILVVDDNFVVVKTIAFKLKSSGYDVCTAMDGSEAVSIVRREHPDLIVLDINFPPDVAHGGGVAWDGFLILDWVRRIDQACHIPVIFITSDDPAKYRERALAAGALAFFQKPIKHEELVAVVQQALGEAGGPSQTGAGTVVRI